MAKRPIFDTYVFSGYSAEIEKIYLSSLFPSIVLFELVATSLDEEALKKIWSVENLAGQNTPADHSNGQRLVGNREINSPFVSQQIRSGQ